MPDHMNIDVICEDLMKTFPDIVNVHELHIWQLTEVKIISTAHIIFLNPQVRVVRHIINISCARVKKFNKASRVFKKLVFSDIILLLMYHGDDFAPFHKISFFYLLTNNTHFNIMNSRLICLVQTYNE